MKQNKDQDILYYRILLIFVTKNIDFFIVKV